MLEALFRYAFTADVEPTLLEPIVVAQLAEEGQEVFMTVADRMIEQGRIEERARMHREYAERLLRMRYGQLDADLLTRMRALDDARVEALCLTLVRPDFEAIDVETLLFGDDTNR